jgi:Tfp pilus assembly protein PilN
MRAVNLIPGEDRASRAARSAGTGGIVYVLLGGLAVLVVLAGVWASTTKQISNQRADLARVTAETAAADARAAKAAPYEAFAAVAQARISTVKSLSETRFDWAHSLRELSRVLPADVWLVSLNGSSGAGGGQPTTTASAAPSPTFEFVGCTVSQAKVASLMARLRNVDGVRDVELKTSAKPDAAGGADDCPANSSSNPTFTIVIAFKAPGTVNEKVDATGQVVAAAAPAIAGAAPGTAAAAPAPAASPPAAGAPSTPPSATSIR